MLKYLLMAGVVLGLAFIIARHDEYGSLKSVQESADSSNPAIAAKPNANPPQKDPGDSYWSSTNGHIFRNAFRWPEGTTVWAIILTLLAIAEQTHETAKAAKATRDSTLAQEKAIKLAVNAQRPYLVISVESQLPDQFVFTAKNEGQTPARINSIWSKLLMADGYGTLQIPSDKEMAESVFSTPPQLLPPKGTCTFFLCDERRLELMRGDAFCAVYFHGRISYSSTLEVDPVEPYETKWLYSQLPLKGKLSIPRPDARRPEHNTWT